MPIPKPAPRGFFTDRSPPVISKADKDFKQIHGRYPNSTEAELAPREGHPLAQVIDWSECELARMYPQWESTLFELAKKRPRMLANHLKGPRIGEPGLSAAAIKSRYSTRYPTDEL